MRLHYDVSIIGLAAINRALASIEKRFVMHNRRLQQKAARLESGSSTAAGAAEKKRHALVMRNLSSEKAAMRGMWGTSANAGVRATQRQHAMAMKNIRTEEAARRRFARTVGRRVGNRVGSTLRSVGSYGAMALGLGGGMLMASALRSHTRPETVAMGLANQAFGTQDARGQTRAQMTKRAMDEARIIALNTGLQKEEILGGVRKFSEKAGGAFAVGLPLAGYFADVAQAHGAKIGDVGSAGGQVFMAAKNAGFGDERAGEITKQLLGSMAGMGKVGAIEFKDMARQAGKIMSAAGQFGKEDLVKNARTMMAIGQFALGGGAQSPEEAGTAVMRFADDAAKNWKRFRDIGGKDQGFSVFTDDTRTQMISPEEILFKSLEKTKGNIPDMMKLFGLRGKKGMQPFRQMVVDTMKGLETAGGGDLNAGIEMARGKMRRMINLSEDPKMTQASAAHARTSMAVRMAKVKERFDQKLAPAAMRIVEALLPALEKLIPLFESGAEALASFLEFFAENPVAGLGVLIAGSVAAEIASAGLAMLITGAFSGPLAAIGPALMGLLGPIALLGVAIGGAYLAYKAIDEMLHPAAQETPVDMVKKEQELQEFITKRKGGHVVVGGFNEDKPFDFEDQPFTMEDEYNAKIDPKTGMPFFNPDIEHGPGPGGPKGPGGVEGLGAPTPSLGLGDWLTGGPGAPGAAGPAGAGPLNIVETAAGDALNEAAKANQSAADHTNAGAEKLAATMDVLMAFPAELSLALASIDRSPTKPKFP